MIPRSIIRGLARPPVRSIVGSSVSIPPQEPGIPTHPLLPILGTATRKKVWFDNDEEDDTYTTESIIAAHIRGKIELIGFSSTAATSVYGDNPTLADAYFNQDMIDRANLITEMGQSGWDMSTVPAPMTPFMGAFGPPAETLAETPRVTGYSGGGMRTGHHATADLVAAIHAHYSPGEPVIIVCGGQLTLVADAYLTDASITSKCVILFVSGNAAIHPYGFYNEWADATASIIVHEHFTMVNFPATSPNITQAVVTKAQLMDRLPQSYLRVHMNAKARTGNSLPDNMDGDGNPVICLMNPAFVRGVTRKRASGTIGKQNAGSREVSALVDDPAGNIYLCEVRQTATGCAIFTSSPEITITDSGGGLFVGQSVEGPGIPAGTKIIATNGTTTATLSAPSTSEISGITLMLNSKAGTDTWWENMTAPELWLGSPALALTPTATDSFSGGSASTLGAGWAQLGTIGRNEVISGVAGKSTTGYAFDIRTETYPVDQYAQARFTSTPVASYFPAVAIRASFHAGNAVNGYYLYPNASTDTRLQRSSAAVDTAILTGMPPISAGQLWRVAARGDLITVWRNNNVESGGVLDGGWKLVGIIRDNGLTSGKPALLNSRSAGPTSFTDDFEAGGVSA